MTLDLQAYQERLLDLQEQIMGITDLVQDAAKTVELDQNRVGRLSRMDAMQGQAMAMASADRQSHQLKLIAAALQRIDDGDYGQCLECDEAIPSARLEADPVTEFCINCAAQRERRDG